jgi:glutathione synthase/RimK-type ligase-like ATP-grasp enzyme
MTSRRPDLAIASYRDLYDGDLETPLLVSALAEVGMSATVVAWDASFDWSSVPLVLVNTTWDYFLRGDEFLDWAKRVSDLTALQNPFEVLAWNSHKSYLVELAERGVPTMQTTLLTRDSQPEAQVHALERHDDSEIVLKPAVGGGALGALRARADSPEAAEHLAIWTKAGEVLIQPLQPEVLTEGEASLMFFGGRFSHAVLKVGAPGDFRVQGLHGGTVHNHVATARQLEVAEAALGAAPGATSYARVDLVRLEDPLVMELELIEPELFLRVEPEAAMAFAQQLAAISQ